MYQNSALLIDSIIFRKILMGFFMMFMISASGQTQLKQLGTKLYDESGRTVKLDRAISLARTKSEKAYVAFQLADYIKRDRMNSVQWGVLWGLWAIVPSGGDSYSWLDALEAGVSVSQFALMSRKSEIEEALKIGVEAFNAEQ